MSTSFLAGSGSTFTSNASGSKKAICDNSLCERIMSERLNKSPGRVRISRIIT